MWVFVETMPGNGRPYRICYADHEYEPPCNGATYGWYRGSTCRHSVLDGYLDDDVSHAERLIAWERHDYCHEQPEPGCPWCQEEEGA